MRSDLVTGTSPLPAGAASRDPGRPAAERNSLR
jgi:hypothetical protein